jgi:hypothetical protein
METRRRKMIEIDKSIKRSNWFWDGKPVEEAVKLYKKELVETKKELEGLPYRGEKKEIVYSTVFKKESADQRVNEYKIKAEEIFEQYKYPLYLHEKNEMDILNKLLWI